MFSYVSRGWADASTWFVVTDEDPQGFFRDGNVSRLLVLFHELFHFWQAISTNYMFWFSVSCNFHEGVWNLFLYLLLKNKRYSEALETPNAEKGLFGAAIDTLTSDQGPISTLDVIEGNAEHLAYRSVFTSHTHSEFFGHLKRKHPGKRNRYSKAYRYAHKHLGGIAFELFGPACFLALQDIKPGESFVTIIRRVARFTAKDHSLNAPLAFMLETIDRAENDCFIRYVVENGVKCNYRHPVLEQNSDLYKILDRNNRVSEKGVHTILQPYIEKIIEFAPKNVADIFARPYYYVTEGTPQHTGDVCKFVHNLWPPLLLNRESTEPVIMGFARDMGDSYIRRLFEHAALSGVISLCYAGVKDVMLCPHQKCPHYGKKLCHRFFAFPRGDYRKCGFPNFLRSKELGQLLK